MPTSSDEVSLHGLAAFAGKPWVRAIALTIFYLAIIVGLILMYGRGDFSAPSFIYQGF